MKPYQKPTIEVIEIRPEERIAFSASKDNGNLSHNNNGLTWDYSVTPSYNKNGLTDGSSHFWVKDAAHNKIHDYSWARGSSYSDIKKTIRNLLSSLGF